MLADIAAPRLPNVLVLITLAVVLASSAAMFRVLAWRWTKGRTQAALNEWGDEAGFIFAQCDPDQLEALAALRSYSPMIHPCLRGHRTWLLRARTIAANPAATGEVTWNLLIRSIDVSWKAAGLRPAAAVSSVLDLFSLSSFPRLGSTERFVVFAADSSEAKQLSGSMLRSLLPPDVALLLFGRSLVLDFSSRPFDELEFDRMIALVEQLVMKLPPPVQSVQHK